MFHQAMCWMQQNDFKPKLWTAGWYIYNSNSIKTAEFYGLKYFKDNWRFSFHDYEWDKIYKLMMIITNIRGVFR